MGSASLNESPHPKVEKYRVPVREQPRCARLNESPSKKEEKCAFWAGKDSRQ